MVLLPGGVINGDALRVEEQAQRFVQQIDRAGKPVMVMVHGVTDNGLSWTTLTRKLEQARALDPVVETASRVVGTCTTGTPRW